MPVRPLELNHNKVSNKLWKTQNDKFYSFSTTGVAPCCAHVMQDVINEFARVMREEKITWWVLNLREIGFYFLLCRRIMTQGQVIALVRDGTLGLFDHDFDPYFGKDAALLARVKELVRTKMHIGGTVRRRKKLISFSVD